MKKIDTFAWVLFVIAAVFLIGAMVAFGWLVIFPLAIFNSSLYFALKRIKVL